MTLRAAEPDTALPGDGPGEPEPEPEPPPPGPPAPKIVDPPGPGLRSRDARDHSPSSIFRGCGEDLDMPMPANPPPPFPQGTPPPSSHCRAALIPPPHRVVTSVRRRPPQGQSPVRGRLQHRFVPENRRLGHAERPQRRVRAPRRRAGVRHLHRHGRPGPAALAQRSAAPIVSALPPFLTSLPRRRPVGMSGLCSWVWGVNREGDDHRRFRAKRDHRGGKRGLPLEKRGWAIFGTQTFGSQTPPLPPPLKQVPAQTPPPPSHPLP